MSTEANTYEEMIIFNRNDATREVTKSLGVYLTGIQGIRSLQLTVDGQGYRYDGDAIDPESELAAVCSTLSESKEISLSLRTCNAFSLYARMEAFLAHLVNDSPELRENITYKSTDYYDTDSCIDLTVYDRNGFHRPDPVSSINEINDIKKWYCYSPEISFCVEEEEENGDLHSLIIQELQTVLDNCTDEDNLDDFVDDDWEDCGEITWFREISFSSDGIRQIADALARIADAMRNYENAEWSIDIQAVPDGENDYDFASVSITRKEDTLDRNYYRF